MNVITLVGNVTKDPEIRNAGDKKVAKFGLATNRPYKKNDHYIADFHNIEVWGNQAGFVEQYVRKGMRVAVTGSQEYENYEKDGATRRIDRVNVNNIEIVEKKNNGEGSAAPAEPAKAAPVETAASDDPF